MKVAVIGAGVIGITTAYELATLGHEVTVFERNGAAAEECSFSNTGVASVSYAAPWAKPGMLKHVLSHLWQRDTPLRISNPSFAEWRWLWKMRKASNSQTFARNRESMLRLAEYSSHRMRTLTDTLNLAHERGQGFMVLLRSERESKLMQASLQVMRDAGLGFKTLSAEEARDIEPALRPETTLAQAIYFPEDEVGNCRQFSLLLKGEAEALGVKFRFNTPIEPLAAAQPKIIRTSAQDLGEKFDAIVVCAGLASAQLVRPLGLHIPLVAIHGYAISAAYPRQDAPRQSGAGLWRCAGLPWQRSPARTHGAIAGEHHDRTLAPRQDGLDGGAATAYTPGTSVGAGATSTIVIQGRRANCAATPSTTR